jgi:hypothetical protein
MIDSLCCQVNHQVLPRLGMLHSSACWPTHAMIVDFMELLMQVEEKIDTLLKSRRLVYDIPKLLPHTYSCRLQYRRTRNGNSVDAHTISGQYGYG